MRRLLNILKGRNEEVKYMRCDRARENVKQLKELCEEFGITPELTASNTPQMNGVVERTLERAMAMLYNASFTSKA